jgi:hypothetical protein
MDVIDLATAIELKAQLCEDRTHEAPGVAWYVGPFPLTDPAHAFRDGALLRDGSKVCKTFICEGDQWCVLASNFKHLEVQ